MIKCHTFFQEEPDKINEWKMEHPEAKIITIETLITAHYEQVYRVWYEE